MQFQSDNQRKAMFAALRAQTKAGGGRVVKTSRSLVQAGQGKFRSFMKKHPLAAELAIGLPVAAAGIYAAKKLGGIKAVANWAAKGGKIRTGLKGIALEAVPFFAADTATRRVLAGPADKRASAEAPIHYSILGGALAEGGYRTALKIPGSKIGAMGAYAAKSAFVTNPAKAAFRAVRRHPVAFTGLTLGFGLGAYRKRKQA